MIKKIIASLMCCFLITAVTVACSDSSTDDVGGETPDITETENLSEQNLKRSMELMDKAFSVYFEGDEMAMSRYYNPYTGNASDEKGSVWMYTSSIEAVNAVLEALQAQKEKGNAALYDSHFGRYSTLLDKLYDNLDYYMGTYTLTSFTQRKKWSIYGVDRGKNKGQASVYGIKNVYDDQMWLIRELLVSYKLTSNNAYLEKAEYLTEYVLDGWDTTRDENGKENGGIPWGPGYVTKHACSNAPIVSPLVWLHEIYKGKSDEVEYRYIDAADKKTRKSEMVKKGDFYLDYAKKVYNWQKDVLMMPEGVYFDMRGGCDPNCNIVYETIDKVRYRANTKLTRSEGTAYSYNSGTMISGAADLYNATGEAVYLEDGKKLADASFNYFAKKGVDVIGYYTYDVTGFNNWFNGVMMRGYVEIYSLYNNVAPYINSYQQNLDYGYTNFLHEGVMPGNLLLGWEKNKNDNDMEGMFSFAYAAEYAILSQFELEK